MLPRTWFAFAALLAITTARAETAPAIDVPPDSPRWSLQGNARASELLGRRCLMLDGGAAVLDGFTLRVRVTFDGDFSRRLEPQAGMPVVYARTRIDADRDEV